MPAPLLADGGSPEHSNTLAHSVHCCQQGRRRFYTRGLRHPYHSRPTKDQRARAKLARRNPPAESRYATTREHVPAFLLTCVANPHTRSEERRVGKECR